MRVDLRFLPLVAVLLFWAGSIFAAEPSIEVHLDPQRLGVEDNARLVISIKNPGRRAPIPALSDLENFEVVAGPSTENRFSWINGEATSEAVITYILQPRQVGAARVGSVGVSVGGTVLRSEPIEAKVVAGSVAPPRRNPRTRPAFNDPFGNVAPQQRTTQAKIILRQVVDTRKLYLGEPLKVTIILDSNTSGIEGFEWVDRPSFPGWWTQQVDVPEGNQEIVEVDGERYQRFFIARFVLVPLKAGELILPASKARIAIRSRSIFARQQVIERDTTEIKIKVEERQAPPSGFSGGVGSLRYSVSLEPTEIELGESAVLTVTLSGQGNLPLVEAPTLWPQCEGCDSYPPEEDSDIKVDESGMHGTRTWHKTIVPRTAGILSLEPVDLAIFDPSAGHYRHQSLGPLSLVVSPPPPTPTPSREPSLGPETVEAVKGDPPPAFVSDKIMWLALLGALFAGALGGGLSVWFFSRRSAFELPARRHGESPADRARELQVHLERWWFDARDDSAAETLHPEMTDLRRELEAVRFAPGRADHSETISDLERRFKELTK